MNVQTWIPPDSGIGSKDLSLWNMAMSHMGTPLPLDGSGIRLRLSPIAAPHVTGPMHVMRTAEGQQFYVHLDAFPYQQMLGVDFDLDAAGDLPSALADAIHAGSAEFLLQKFPDTLTAGMTYQATQADALDEAGGLQWFAAALDGLAETPAFFSIGAKASAICAFLNGSLQQSRTVLTALRQTLDVALHRLVGRAVLKVGDVRGLDLGDFIVLEDAVSDNVVIRSDDRAFYFETVEEGWRCTAIHPFKNVRKMSAMDDTPSDPKEPENETLAEMAEAVSTVLTFECGTASVTMAELEAFQTGAIVPLPSQLTENGVQVTIRAGDHAIAKGEIVQIDDRVAVRSSQLLTRTL